MVSINIITEGGFTQYNVGDLQSQMFGGNPNESSNSTLSRVANEAQQANNNFNNKASYTVPYMIAVFIFVIILAVLAKFAKDEGEKRGWFNKPGGMFSSFRKSTLPKGITKKNGKYYNSKGDEVTDEQVNEMKAHDKKESEKKIGLLVGIGLLVLAIVGIFKGSEKKNGKDKKQEDKPGEEFDDMD